MVYEIIGTWSRVALPTFREAVGFLRSVKMPGSHILANGREVAHYCAEVGDVVSGPRRVLIPGDGDY